MRIVIIAVVLASLTGCSHLTSPGRSKELTNNTYWFDYDASRRGAILVRKADGYVRMCSEPAPDVALALVSKLEASLKKEDLGDAAAQAEFNSAVVQLAQRTQMVMFLRESLFRLCEQSVNGNWTSEQVSKAYMDTITAATELAKAELAKAEEDRARAETERANANSKELLIQRGATPDDVRKLFK